LRPEFASNPSADIEEANPMTPDHINPLQWHQALGVARQSCARVFRDGGKPADALAAFGLEADAPRRQDWAHAVDLIAQSICATPMRRAA
jgi:hypothetical protein